MQLPLDVLVCGARVMVTLHCAVVGGTHHPEEVAKFVEIASMMDRPPLNVLRDTNNMHDSNAISVCFTSYLLGFLPRNVASKISNHIDQGRVIIQGATGIVTPNGNVSSSPGSRYSIDAEIEFSCVDDQTAQYLAIGVTGLNQIRRSQRSPSPQRCSPSPPMNPKEMVVGSQQRYGATKSFDGSHVNVPTASSSAVPMPPRPPYNPRMHRR